MRRLLVAIYRLYFLERIVFWLFMVGAGFLVFWLVSQSKFAVMWRFSAIAFMAGFPLVAVITQYAYLRKNRHILMVPYGPSFMLGATLSLVLIVCGALAWNVSSMPMADTTGFWTVFLVVFCFASLGTVLASMSNVQRGVLIMLSFVLVLILFRYLFPTAWMSFKAAADIYLLVVSPLCWIGLAASLRRETGTKRIAAHPIVLRYRPVLDEYIGSIATSPARLDAKKTMTFRVPTTEASRIVAKAIHVFILPVIGLAYMWIFLDPAVWGELLLLIQFFAIVIVPITVGEQVPASRALWLRLPGDRKQFWALWRGFAVTELLLTMLLLSIFGLLVTSIFDVSHVSMALYAVVLVLLLPSMTFLAAWCRAENAPDNRIALWGGVAYLASVVVLIIATYATKNYQPVAALAIFSAATGLLAYFRLKARFVTLDWSRIRSADWAKV